MKIAHLADIHIRLIKYHDNYRKSFDELYSSLRKENPDIIVVVGDIFHSKNNLSPEAIELASSLFSNLAKISKTIITPGNHDMILSNKNRMDAITPVIANLKNSNLIYLKGSAIHREDNFVFNHLSLYDIENRVEPKEDDINIALYHGAIAGSKTDTGWVIEKGDNDISIFKGCDYAMLGDIHKANQVLDTEGRVRYCGSLIQQNFGEDTEKGYLLWDIQDKDNFVCEFVPVKNECNFINVPFGEEDFPENSMVRVLLPDNLTKQEIDDYLFHISTIKTPKLLTSITEKGFKKKGEGLKVNTDDLQLDEVQEKFLTEFIENNVEDEKIKLNVLKISKNYEVPQEKNINVNWTLDSVKWENLFCFQGSNSINFNDKPGILGIFGQNYSGKSSVIETILLGLFNATSKTINRNSEYINENEDEGLIELSLTSGDTVFEITRDFKRKGDSASCSVEFKIDGEPMNGQSRTDTDKIIQSYIGSKEDFVNTTISNQFGSLEFVESRPTQRRELISRFFGLDIFKEKHTKVSKDYLESKSSLDILQKKIDNSIPIKEYEELIREAQDELKSSQEKLLELKTKQTEKTIEHSEIIHKIKELPQDLKSVSSLEQKETSFNKILSDLEQETEVLQQKVSSLEEKISKIEEERNSINLVKLKKTKEEIDLLKIKLEEVSGIDKDFSKKEDQIEKAKTTIKVPPCHVDNKNCCKVIEARKFLESQQVIISNIEKAQKLSKVLTTKIDSLDESTILSNINKREQLDLLIEGCTKELDGYSLKLKEKEHTKEKVSLELRVLRQELKEAAKTRELFLRKEEIFKQKDLVEKELEDIRSSIKSLDSYIAQDNRKIGGFEEKINSINDIQKEYNEKLFEYESLEILRSAYHNKGIPLMIIKEKIHILNDEIALLLGGLVNFSIFLEEDENVEIMIHHQGQKPRSINLGSGAEKIFASIVIRIALMNISNLSKAELFIFDEPATGLDQEHMEKFMTILDVVKKNYRNVILISHLESLKENVDHQIDVTKNNDVSVLS
jgi:DNA repair exonuclease SbcCD ATPase subunit/DNA repair exonuclease SbcCD nuclease subunit